MKLETLTDVDLTIGDLIKRYGISRTTLSNRMKVLNLVSKRSGSQYTVSCQDVELLDKLHQWIGSGRSMRDFVNRVASPNGINTVDGVITIDTKGIVISEPPRSDDSKPVRTLEELHQCLEWLVWARNNKVAYRTIDLAQLLGVSKESIRGNCFRAYGFVFKNTGYKWQRSNTWWVS